MSVEITKKIDFKFKVYFF